MSDKSVKNQEHIHFIGVCGISMSGLAVLAKEYGCAVTGSDISSDIPSVLIKNNITVYRGHSEDNISDDCDMVVYTGAISEDNVELKYAISKGIKVVERSEFLGVICKLYDNVIAIAGTHGKTTTTSMIGHIFDMANLKPTIHMGGISNNFESNMVVGDRKYFITEACEYKNSFRYIHSNYAVITSTDPDHMDCYSSVVELNNAYQYFAKNSKNLVLVDSVKGIYKKGSILVGIDDGDIYATNIEYKDGRYSFDCYYFGKYLTNFKLYSVGRFNIYNALCAIAVAMEYGISISCIYDALISYKGVKRRNEKICDIGGVPVICDYAHHPTEISNIISAYKSHYKKVMCIFQPHTYSRTKLLMNKFITSFKGVKTLIIYKTYPAREQKIDGGDAFDLYKKVKISEKNKYIAYTKYKLKKIIYENIENIDCVLILGAGNIYNIAKNMLKS